MSEPKYLSLKAAEIRVNELVSRSDKTKISIASDAGIARQWMARALDMNHPFVMAKVFKALGYDAEVAIRLKEKEVSE